MRIKKGVLAMVCLSLTLFGCAKAPDYVTQSQKYPWILAHASSTDTITSIFADKFAQEVERLSHGRMQIDVYANSTIGGDRELIESCLGKDVKFVVQNTAPQVSFMPELAIFDLPMVYDDIQDVRKALDDKEFMHALQNVYTQAGFQLLTMADQSFRVMTTNEPVYSIDDFKGQKIRTMENNYHLSFWQNIGANPTPMSFSEVYIGLQQGTIDAQENPIEVIVSSRLYEQQAYIIETNHLPHLLSLITNQEFYQSLSSKDQKIIDQASQNARDYARKMSDERIAQRLDICKENHVQIISIDDALRQEMRQKNTQLYEDIAEKVGDSIYETYLKYADWR